MSVGIKQLAKGRSDLYSIEPRDLHVKDGWNVRDIDPVDIAELALSIAEIGVKQPLTAIMQDDKLYITDGHRRYFATLLAIENGAEILTVPVRLEDRYSSEADHVSSMLIRNSGKPLSPLEQSKVFKRLIDFGWTETQIANKSGKSRQWVITMLELNGAGEDVKELVRTGKVTATLATQVIASDGAEAGKTLTQAVKKAEAAGKTKATAKHIEKAPSAKEQLKTLFNGLQFQPDEASGNYGVWFTADQYAAFRSLAGL